MKELLERYGYKYTGNCNCEGFQTEKYSFGNYQLRVRSRKGQFRMRHEGRSLTQWIPVATLQQTLQNIHTNVAV